MAEETPPSSALEPKEEFFENQATDVEAEDTGSTREGGKPWEPAKIRISTKPFSLRQITDMIKDGDLDLAPDFQRMFVWKPVQRSRLIESVLLGIPLPAFYFNQNPEGAMQVVDGLQRLTTIYSFVQGEPIADLEYLRQWEGKRFEDLDAASRRRFQQTQIFVNVIEPQTPDDVKFDVFRRINTGGSPLTAQEIRHCMSRAHSRELLKRLIALPSFKTATDNAFASERRMADREAVLRFLAFRSLKSLDEYRAFESFDAFLLDFTRRLDGAPQARGPAVAPKDEDRLCEDFDRAMKNAFIVFGNAAFRKYTLWAKRRGPINRALFESWAVALADYQAADLAPHKDAIVQETRRRMGDYDYNASTTQGTGDFSTIRLRFSVSREILQRHVTPQAQP